MTARLAIEGGEEWQELRDWHPQTRPAWARVRVTVSVEVLDGIP